MGFFSSLAAAVLDPSPENTRRFRGAKGEAQAAAGLRLFLPSTYTVINDVLLPTPDGTTQIDHVVVSTTGIFVIESKAISGAIYGSAGDVNWTVCRGQSKYTIYNPLRQNACHIKALVAATDLPAVIFHSLVFFWSDDCQFQTPMPENVRQSDLCGYIRSKTRCLISEGGAQAAIRMIAAARISSTRASREEHSAHLRRRFQAPKLLGL
jgi:restriction system protein